MFTRIGNINDYISLKPHLIVEYLEGNEKSLYCNSAMIERAFSSGKALVAYGPRGVVGFSTLEAGGDALTWVRQDVRNEGIGSALLEKKTEWLKQAGVNFVLSNPATEDSERFLRNNGFRNAIAGQAKEFGYLVREIEHKYSVPPNLHSVCIQVSVFPEAATYPTGSKQPAFSFEQNGRLFGNRILLEKRIAFFPVEIEDPRDLIVQIFIDGQSIYFKKAKYPEAEALGVRYEHEDGSFYLDQIVRTTDR